MEALKLICVIASLSFYCCSVDACNSEGSEGGKSGQAQRNLWTEFEDLELQIRESAMEVKLMEKLRDQFIMTGNKEKEVRVEVGGEKLKLLRKLKRTTSTASPSPSSQENTKKRSTRKSSSIRWRRSAPGL